MERIIARRLEEFVENHVYSWDSGDGEYGPSISEQYIGPDWAIELVIETEMPGWSIPDSWAIPDYW